MDSEISRVRFSENVEWGNKSRVLEETIIENDLSKNKKVINLGIGIGIGDILAVYRNLRENYEYRLRYDVAGDFFIREMEMKRKYKEITIGISQNNRIIRNFSLTGLYYHLSRYGQSFSRPALFGVGIVLFSTFLWLTQPDPAASDFSIINATLPVTIDSTNLGTAFERSLTNYLPDLSLGTEAGAGLLDIAFKIIGGAVTFGLIIIALRRKFERKFRH